MKNNNTLCKMLICLLLSVNELDFGVQGSKLTGGREAKSTETAMSSTEEMYAKMYRPVPKSNEELYAKMYRPVPKKHTDTDPLTSPTFPLDDRDEIHLKMYYRYSDTIRTESTPTMKNTELTSATRTTSSSPMPRPSSLSAKMRSIFSFGSSKKCEPVLRETIDPVLRPANLVIPTEKGSFDTESTKKSSPLGTDSDDSIEKEKGKATSNSRDGSPTNSAGSKSESSDSESRKNDLGPKLKRGIPSEINVPVRRSMSPFGGRSTSPFGGRQSTMSPVNNSFSRKRGIKMVKLPEIRNTMVFGDCEDYDRIFAMALYMRDGEEFDPVADTGYDMIARMMLVSRSTLSYNLYNEYIEKDLKAGPFLEFVLKLQRYSNTRDHEDSDIELIQAASKSMVACCLGKGSTISQEDIWKIGEASQRVVFTPRDIFYYPGMLKLAALFNQLFDPNRANGFFDQFIRTFYSGVYGPRRKDLYYIARIQSIPESVITNKMLNVSLGREVEADGGEDPLTITERIEMTREHFLDPANRAELVATYGKEELAYTELDPVPKTLEDVLEATEAILLAHWQKHSPAAGRRSSLDLSMKNIKKKVNNPFNIQQLQSFYLDLYSPVDVKVLLDAMFMNLGNGANKPEYRDHAAAFMYAAFLKASNEDMPCPPVSEILRHLGEMYNTRISASLLNKIHARSEAEADVDSEIGVTTERGRSDEVYDDLEADNEK